MGALHNFNERLRFSENAEDFWWAVYKKAFPTMVGWVRHSGKTDAQRRGVDCIVYLASDRVIRIDEKYREQDYPDILLEYVSVDSTGAPGWIEKELAIDYIAYAFEPSRRVYLLPWDLLRRSWLHHGEQWKAKYRKVEALNEGYKTISVAVPIKVLLETLRASTILDMTL